MKTSSQVLVELARCFDSDLIVNSTEELATYVQKEVFKLTRQILDKPTESHNRLTIPDSSVKAGHRLEPFQMIYIKYKVPNLTPRAHMIWKPIGAIGICLDDRVAGRCWVTGSFCSDLDQFCYRSGRNIIKGRLEYSLKPAAAGTPACHTRKFSLEEMEDILAGNFTSLFHLLDFRREQYRGIDVSFYETQFKKMLLALKMEKVDNACQYAST